MVILPATPSQSAEITELIMLAMNHDCCRNWAGSNHTLDDFRQVMETLVKCKDSQYSYRNCLVAMKQGDLMGVLVAYNGADLHRLREPFIQSARKHFQKDYSHIEDETTAGEFYLDSLAVKPQYRHRGVATTLLHAGIERARSFGILRVGLLVDLGNPSAEKLYRSLGFQYVNDTTWGGHPMRHLQFLLD